MLWPIIGRPIIWRQIIGRLPIANRLFQDASSFSKSHIVTIVKSQWYDRRLVTLANWPIIGAPLILTWCSVIQVIIAASPAVVSKTSSSSAVAVAGRDAEAAVTGLVHVFKVSTSQSTI